MSCLGIFNGCSCRGCVQVRGVKFNQLPDSGTVSTAQQFVMADNGLVSVQTLINFIQSLLTTPPITRVDAPSPTYAMTGDEDVVWCSGDVVVTLALTDNGNRVAHFNSNGGTVSFVAQAGETESVADITDGNARAIAANANTKEWREV